MIDHFTKFFFTEKRRLDYELTAEKHKQAQEENKLSNLTKWFSKPEDRIEIHDSLQAFKKKMALHPDIFKANFATFKL